MKKILTILALAISAMTMMAQERYGKLYYIVVRNQGSYSASVVHHEKYKKLQSIAIPDYITYKGNTAPVIDISEFAFHKCFSLTSITIPNSVTEIGDNAFYDCSALTSITIPRNVTTIGMQAFSNCSSLTSITIPRNVTTIGERAFFNCSSLTNIVVEEGNTHYDSRNHCNAIIETATNTLIIGCQNTIVPNSIISIGERAFCNCKSMTSITLPQSVKNIGHHAFHNCSSLKTITIPNSVIAIGERAFLEHTEVIRE